MERPVILVAREGPTWAVTLQAEAVGAFRSLSEALAIAHRIADLRSLAGSEPKIRVHFPPAWRAELGGQ